MFSKHIELGSSRIEHFGSCKKNLNWTLLDMKEKS